MSSNSFNDDLESNGTPSKHTTTSPSGGEIDQLYVEVKKGVKESVSISKFIEKRVQIEDEYAKSLLRLCKTFPLGSTYVLLLLHSIFIHVVVLIWYEGGVD